MPKASSRHTPHPDAWTVASDYGVLLDVLLCRPDHYRWLPLNSVVQANLRDGASASVDTAQLQHAELAEALRSAGVNVHWALPECHLAYQVYTRDALQMTRHGAILTQLARAERRGEYASVMDALAALEVPIWRKSSSGTLEGGDIHVVRPDAVAIGVSGGRTNIAGATQLSDWLRENGCEVTIVPFPKHFLHLDLLFAMVADGLAVACVDVLDEAFISWLTARNVKVVPATYKEAITLRVNAVSLGLGKVISTTNNDRINSALRAEGLDVIEVDLSVFTRGGGGPRCLTAPLRRRA